MSMEDVAKRRPVNETAANVLKKGVHYDNRANAEFVSEVPLPLRDEVNDIRLAEEHGRKVGSVYGRLTVIGLSRDERKKYVCRCLCGRYCLRHTKSLGSSKCIQMCGECRQVEHLRDLDYFQRNGKWPDRAGRS